MANTLSHYEIWNTDEDTLVLEDDVIFDNNLFNNLSTIITEFKSIQSTGKILYLQISTPWLQDAKEKKISLNKVTENIGKYMGGDISGTSAYYITKETKKIILNNIKPFTACDRYLELFVKDSLIEYYVPLDKENMFKLDTNTMWL